MGIQNTFQSIHKFLIYLHKLNVNGKILTKLKFNLEVTLNFISHVIWISNSANIILRDLKLSLHSEKFYFKVLCNLVFFTLLHGT